MLTDERYAALFTSEERDVIAAHVPWTRMVTEERAEDIRRRREQLVLKPNNQVRRHRRHARLGNERGRMGRRDRPSAAGRRRTALVVQERIAVRRELFPVCEATGIVERDMLVDFAPYLFRGRVGGFLTRLSATGLANVTSGGGQVPAFVVAAKGGEA